MKHGSLWVLLVLFVIVQGETAFVPPCGYVSTSCDRAGYTDNAKLESFLFTTNDKYPNITRLFSIGKAVSGKSIWGIEISTTPGQPEVPKPNLKYIGDEVIGRELLINLVTYVLASYGSTSEEGTRITSLVNSTNLFILPTVNPDGFDSCSSPDQFKGASPQIQTETQNIMDWIAKGQQWDRNGNKIEKLFRYTLSANFHGGDVVVNYPYDGNGKGRENGITDDDLLFKHLATAYASKNPSMMANTDFEKGITNGVAWYPLYGGMQDWNYVWQGCMETTIEVSCQKWPSYQYFPEFWEENKESMISYWEQLNSGVKGRVIDSKGNGIEASIVVKGRNFTVYTQKSFYHRLLNEHTYYTLEASAPGYEPSSVKFKYTGGSAEVHFRLRRTGEVEPESPTQMPTTGSEPKETTPHASPFTTPEIVEEYGIPTTFYIVIIVGVIVFVAVRLKRRRAPRVDIEMGQL